MVNYLIKWLHSSNIDEFINQIFCYLVILVQDIVILKINDSNTLTVKVLYLF